MKMIVNKENSATIPIDLDEVLQHSVEAAKRAARILQENYGKLKPEDIKKKHAFDFVTEVDKAAEFEIINYLQEFYPDHRIFAEESGKNQAESDFQWLIDPLDGTKNYIHCIPNYGVSIALRYRNKIIAGVINVPPWDELFTAKKEGGAFLNDEPIHVSTTNDFAVCMLATGFPHDAKQYLDVYLDCFKHLFLQVSAIRRPGAAAVDLANVACGRFDGFWEFKLNPWDIGAGLLLIKEAGGIVSDPLGGQNHLSSGDLAAGNPAIYEKIIKIIKPICEGRLG